MERALSALQRRILAAAGKASPRSLQSLLAEHPALSLDFADRRFSPLGRAAKAGRIASVRLLLTRASVNFVSPDGWTAIHVAAAEGRPAIVEALIEARANVNARLPSGETPLILASQFNTAGHADVMRLLLRARADANVADKGGFTALYVAVHSPEMVRLLLAHGADKAILCDGTSALQFAISRQYWPSAKLLDPAFVPPLAPPVPKRPAAERFPDSPGAVSRPVTMADDVVEVPSSPDREQEEPAPAAEEERAPMPAPQPERAILDRWLAMAPRSVDPPQIARALGHCASAQASALSLDKHCRNIHELAELRGSVPVAVPNVAALNAENTTATLNAVTHELRNIQAEMERVAAMAPQHRGAPQPAAPLDVATHLTLNMRNSADLLAAAERFLRLSQELNDAASALSAAYRVSHLDQAVAQAEHALGASVRERQEQLERRKRVLEGVKQQLHVRMATCNITDEERLIQQYSEFEDHLQRDVRAEVLRIGRPRRSEAEVHDVLDHVLHYPHYREMGYHFRSERDSGNQKIPGKPDLADPGKLIYLEIKFASTVNMKQSDAQQQVLRYLQHNSTHCKTVLLVIYEAKPLTEHASWQREKWSKWVRQQAPLIQRSLFTIYIHSPL